jgi:PhzF family phenazine biosynthesis protein
MFQVDAFTSELFSGNPAAICLLDEWLPDELMLSIAAENNLSETAFLNLSTDPIGIRWFSPKREVDLCGHATLASARVLFDQSKSKDSEEIVFESKRGLLKAEKDGEIILLDFPSDKPELSDLSFSESLFSYRPVRVIKGTDDYLFIFDQEEKIKSINANYEEIRKLDSRGAIVSSVDSQGDIVSRCFYPKYGINEDPVTGSAHTLIIPYWSSVLGRTRIKARQLSERGGELFCEVLNDRIKIGGYTSIFFSGEIDI